MSKATILLVEDDKVQGNATRNYLETSGYEVMWVEDGKSAIKSVKTQEIDLAALTYSSGYER